MESDRSTIGREFVLGSQIPEVSRLSPDDAFDCAARNVIETELDLIGQ